MIHPKILKALYLLDRGRSAEAEVDLREALNAAEGTGDEENVLRAASILGELLYTQERDDEARMFLTRVSMAVRTDDVLDYEVGRATELLKEING